MITLKVFGTIPPCANCKRAEREAEKAAAQFPNQVDVVKLDVMSEEAQEYGLVMTPMIVVDDEVVSSGKVMPAKRLVPVIEEHLQRS
jgi:disulfide oxidoreductase YuzD